MLTAARHMLRKRSMPRISAIPATGMVGITIMVATSAMKAAPCTPLAPLAGSTATPRIVKRRVSGETIRRGEAQMKHYQRAPEADMADAPRAALYQEAEAR